MAFPAPAPIGRTFEEDQGRSILVAVGVLAFIQALLVYALAEALLKLQLAGVAAAGGALAITSIAVAALLRHRDQIRRR